MFNNHWTHLRSGEIVEIIATTPGLDISKIDELIAFTAELAKISGINLKINREKIIKGADYFSNNALKIRQEELIRALTDPKVRAIWCIRGGYGTSRLLPMLHNLVKPKISKLIIGYSDINCLHLWLNKFWDWPSLHAKVLYELFEEKNFNYGLGIKSLLCDNTNIIEYCNLIPLNSKALEHKLIKGKITGGTVQVLQSGIGLDWQFQSKNKIIFLEEIFDRGVRLERSLNHFKQLNLFSEAQAILFGDITCGAESDGTKKCDQAIKYFAENIDIPVLQIPGIGHGEQNKPLPLNLEAELNLREVKLQYVK